MTAIRRILGLRRPPLSGAALLVIAMFGLVAAIGFTVSPVTQDEFFFEFRPTDSTAINVIAVAPFAIARAEPDAVELRMPCGMPGSEFRSLSVGSWISDGRTIRSPLPYQPVDGEMVVTVSDGVVAITLDGVDLLGAPVAPDRDCEALILFRDASWSLTVDGDTVTAPGSGPRFGEAIFSGPAADSVVSSVRVETRAVGSSPTVVQLALLVLALGTIVVVARQMVPRPVLVRDEKSSLWSRLRAPNLIRMVDVVVVGMLAAWAFLIPAFFDDGWLWTVQREYPTHGDFSGIFENAAASPLGYWLSWVQHLWTGVSTFSIVIRLPLVVLGTVTWVGLRSIGRRLAVSARSLWVMAAVFVVGFGAWGMTWRPEPVVAALVVASLAFAVRFSSGERGRVLVAWPVVIALAVTAHPAGVIAVAPLLASWKEIVAWIRSNRRAALTAITVVVLAATIAVLLFFVDGNLATKLESIDAARAGEHQRSIFDEFSRYRLLSGENGTVLRRTSVVLMIAGAFAFLLRSGRTATTALSRLPGWSLVTSLVLLALTPSKWEWHFGALVGLAALVVAIELGRLAGPGRRDEQPTSKLMTTAGVTVALGAAMAWAWSTDTQWAPLDLRTQKWWKGAVNLFPVDLSSWLVWVGIAALVWGAVALRGRRAPGSLSWSPPAAMAVVASALVIAVTGATLSLDVVRTDGWTFGRQNLESLWGSAGCGLAEEIVVPVAGSLHQLLADDDRSDGADVAADRAGFGVDGVFTADGFPHERFNSVPPLAEMSPIVGSWVEVDGDTPDLNRGSYRSPWHSVAPTDAIVALTVMGWFEPLPADGEPDERWSKNAVAVQWGAQRESGVDELGLVRAELDAYLVDWSLVTFAPPVGADRVRVLVLDDSSGGEGAWVASSQPLGASLGTFPESGAMITPPLIPYFPCVETPSFENTRITPPSVIVVRNEFWQTPFVVAASVDRYFDLRADLPPGRERDPVVIAVSQEYLTGNPARATGEFVSVDR